MKDIFLFLCFFFFIQFSYIQAEKIVSYDANGNVTEYTSSYMRMISYSYDPLNRLIGIDYPTADVSKIHGYNPDGVPPLHSVSKKTKIMITHSHHCKNLLI